MIMEVFDAIEFAYPHIRPMSMPGSRIRAWRLNVRAYIQAFVSITTDLITDMTLTVVQGTQLILALQSSHVTGGWAAMSLGL